MQNKLKINNTLVGTTKYSMVKLDNQKGLFFFTMKTAILQSNYIPWKGYFDLINSVDVFVIYDNVQYTKNDWRNRNKIVSNGKASWLTIPVQKESLAQSIRETKIADTNWSKKHWRTIQQSYSKTPYFNKFSEQIENIYQGFSDEIFLSKINTKLIIGICEILGIQTKIIQDEIFTLPEDRLDKLVEICVKTDADTYVSGPAAKIYLDVKKFNDAGIQVEWIQYDEYPKYEQRSDNFDHFVSILDLLFCYGDDFNRYLEKSR